MRKDRLVAQATKAEKAEAQVRRLEEARARATGGASENAGGAATRVLTEGLISPEKLAKSMDVPLSTIWRLAREGKLPFVPVGQQIRFSPSEVLTELRRQRDERLTRYKKD